MSKILYAVGAFLIVAFLVMGAREMLRAQTPYVESVAEVVSAPADRSVQFLGSVVKGKTEYSTDGKTLTFSLKDKGGKSLTIKYKGLKPQNFDSAPMVVVRGVYNGTEFNANQVMTKCPSKYKSK